MNINNVFGMAQQVMKQVKGGNPNDFLNAFVQNNKVPQNILNQAQQMASNALPQVQGMFGKQ